jgi:hypothetical protein
VVVRQRFLEHYNFEVSGGYTTTPYVGFATVGELTGNNQIGGTPVTTTTIQQNRSDVTRFLRVSVGTTFRRHGNVDIYYSFNDTSSTLSSFSLTSSQVGIELGWHY